MPPLLKAVALASGLYDPGARVVYRALLATMGRSLSSVPLVSRRHAAAPDTRFASYEPRSRIMQ